MFSREGCTGITISHLPEEQEDAKDAKAAVEADGAEVNLVSVNLMADEQCKALVDGHLKKFGKLDILVNNASKQIICKKFEQIDLKQVESTFRSNILQIIVNTTSVTAYKGSGGLVDYSSTKGAIVAFTRSLAVQLAPRGIRAPVPPEEMEGLGVGMPLHGRAAQPAELGPAYVFLASSADSNIMTGQVLHMNNGQHIGAS
ncbi:hypothetical protein FPV67DRAFT_1663598 [Lyophyllum atratum]|nr:hypothetical protein FPV67DRAFT_1663598 [Lyophyllum atratum]